MLQIVFLLFISISFSWAQSPFKNNFQEFPAKKSMTYLASGDSLFVIIENEQKYLVHTIKPGQTLYSLKKFYGLDFSDIYYSNPGVETNGLKVGQKLRIPIVHKALVYFKNQQFRDTSHIPVFYRVKPKETMFRISRVLFRLPADIIKSRNKLSSDALSKNQILHIAWISKQGIPDSLRTYTGLPGVLGEENQKNKYRYEAKLAIGKEYYTDGSAYWDKDMNLSAKNKLYVMSSIVPQGSVLRIENPLTKRFLYAKVVAPIPNNSYTKGAIVMLTPTVADALGALDTRFYIRVSYCK